MRDFGEWFSDTTKELNKTHSISNEKPTTEDKQEAAPTYVGLPHEWPYVDVEETPSVQDTGTVPDVLEYRTQKKAYTTRKYTG